MAGRDGKGRRRGRKPTLHLSSTSVDKRRNAIFSKEDMNFLYRDFVQVQVIWGRLPLDSIIHMNRFLCLESVKVHQIGWAPGSRECEFLPAAKPSRPYRAPIFYLLLSNKF